MKNRFLVVGLTLLIGVGIASISKAADSDSLVVTDSGNVGIGTNAPDAKLKIIGYNNPIPFNISDLFTIDISAGQGLASLVAGAEINSEGTGYNFTSTRGASRISLHDGEIRFFTSSETTGTAGAPVEDLIFGNSKFVLKSTGNVGIGTGSPESKLDVRGGVKFGKGSIGNTAQVAENGWLRDAWLTAQGNTNLHWDDNSKTWKRSVSATPPYYGCNDFGGILFYSDRLSIIKGLHGSVGEWSNQEFVDSYVKLSIHSNGNVGIGIDNPQDKLDVAGYVRANGTRLTSDIRWKENIEPIDNALDIVTQLRGVSYDWIDPSRGEGRQIGVIAQEVEEVLPEVVHTDSHGYKSVEYTKLVAPLIEAVKVLKKENEMLKERVTHLETLSK